MSGPPPARTAVRSVGTMSAYRDRVEQAVRLLDRESGQASGSPLAAARLAAALDGLLPRAETVALDGRSVPVDNSVLRGLTERLRAASARDVRVRTVSQIREYLASLLASAGTRPVPAVPSDRAALRALLAARRAQTANDLGAWVAGLVQRAIDAIGLLWGRVTETPGGAFVADILKWVILLVLAVVLALAAWRLLARVRQALAGRDRASIEASAEWVVADDAHEPLPDDVLPYADRLAHEARFRDGVRTLLRGSVRSVRRAGLVGHTTARTNAEVLSAIAGSPVAVRTAMRELVARFDRAWYGHSDPGETGFADARERYEQLVRELGRAGEETGS